MDYNDVYNRLFMTTRQAGIIAKRMQKGILNEGKAVAVIDGEDAYHKAMREAKTSVDEMVQEMLLHALLPEYQHIVTLDVEEDTPSQQYFSCDDNINTLVIDPIDGTLDYLNQLDTYSICSALIHQGDIKVAIVYFPQRDMLYGYAQGMGTRIYQQLSMDISGKPLDYEPLSQVPDIIYKNSRVDAAVLRLCSGSHLIDDSFQHLGCPDAIAMAMRGEALAYVSKMRNIRDILLGAILSKMPHGHAYDFQGQKASWASHGRQDEIVFSIYPANMIFSE